MKNLLVWFEIPATDINRAVAFYNTVFNLQLTVQDCGEEKMACFPEYNGVSGALSVASGFTPTNQGTQVTFNGGDNLDDTLSRVTAAGGKIVRKKTKIEAQGRGYFALFSDTEGNTLGLYSDN